MGSPGLSALAGAVQRRLHEQKQQLGRASWLQCTRQAPSLADLKASEVNGEVRPALVRAAAHCLLPQRNLQKHTVGEVCLWSPCESTHCTHSLCLQTSSPVALRTTLTWYKLCMQVPEQEHVPAFYDQHDPSRRTTEFANEQFVLTTNALSELPAFDADVDRVLSFRAKCARLEQPFPTKVCPEPICDCFVCRLSCWVQGKRAKIVVAPHAPMQATGV